MNVQNRAYRYLTNSSRLLLWIQADIRYEIHVFIGIQEFLVAGMTDDTFTV